MFTFKGISSEGKLRVLKVTRTLLPQSKVQTMNIEGKAGTYFIRKDNGVREIEIEAVIIGDSQEDLNVKVEQIADWLDSEKPEAMTFSDEPNRTYYAILNGTVDINEQARYGFITLKFLCPDPYKYGLQKTVSLVEGSNTVNYKGTAPTFPIITTTFSVPTSDFEITNGSEKIHIKFAFDTDTTLVIDTKTGKVTINGTLNMSSMVPDSEMFPLVKGQNNLTVVGGNNVTLSFVERFK